MKFNLILPFSLIACGAWAQATNAPARPPVNRPTIKGATPRPALTNAGILPAGTRVVVITNYVGGPVVIAPSAARPGDTNYLVQCNEPGCGNVFASKPKRQGQIGPKPGMSRTDGADGFWVTYYREYKCPKCRTLIYVPYEVHTFPAKDRPLP